ncbi:MAG: SURF1 family protein [Gammaproteobacteria bacterium]|nr:SURF1 family protein [Gammaproteobacteria bacterium]
MRGNLNRPAAATAAYVLFFAALALLLSLGNWQWRRGAEKAAIETQLERNHYITLDRAPPDWNAVAWRRVRLEGAWLTGPVFLLANRIHRGRPGYEVFSPFQLAGDRATLLVNRGWLDASDSAAPAGWQDAGADAAVSGRLYLPQKGFTLGAAHSPAAQRPGGAEVFQYFDAAAWSEVFGSALQPAAVALDAGHPRAFERIWRGAAVTSMRHFGYAVQWWGLAATLLVFGVIWRGRAARRRREPSLHRR